jgi:hypothetical protein
LTWDRWHARARLRCSRSIRLRAETEGLSSISRSRGAKVGGSERTTWQRVPKSQTSCSSAANLIRSLQHARARLRGSRSIRLRAVIEGESNRAEIEGLSLTERCRGAKVGDSERTTWQRVPKSHASLSLTANLIWIRRHARARPRGSRSIRLRAVIEGLSSTLRSRGAKVVVRAWHEPVPKSHSIVAWTDAIFLLFARHHCKASSDTPATTRIAAPLYELVTVCTCTVRDTGAAVTPGSRLYSTVRVPELCRCSAG